MTRIHHPFLLTHYRTSSVLSRARTHLHSLGTCGGDNSQGVKEAATLLHIVVSKRMDDLERVLFFCVCCDAVLRIRNMDQKRLFPKRSVVQAEVVLPISERHAGNSTNRVGEASDLSSGLLRLIQYAMLQQPGASSGRYVVVFCGFLLLHNLKWILSKW